MASCPLSLLSIRISLCFLVFSTFISAARFDHFNIPDDEIPTIDTSVIVVGPEDPPTQCLALFGQPDPSDCNHMLHHYLGQSDSPGEFETIAEALIQAWATRVTQFLGPGASAEDFSLPTWKLPSTSVTDPRYPRCQITLLTTTMPGTTNTDSATWLDVYIAANDVLAQCVSPRDSSSGGFHILGQNNKLVVFIYNPNSEFKDAIDLEAGCVRRGRDKIYNMLNRFGFFTQACVENSEETSAGSSASDGCTSGTAQIASVLYGLGGLGRKLMVNWCQQSINSIQITS